MKRGLKLLLILFMLFAFSFPASAMEQDSNSKHQSEVSDLFIEFVDNAFSNLDTLEAKDSKGEDVTKLFIRQAQPLFNKKDYKSIQDLIIEQDLDVSYAEINEVKLASGDEFTTDAIRMTRVSRNFYARGTSGGWTKEWIVTLTGDIHYDDRSFKITSVSSPRLSLKTANFGMYWSPYLDNISTSGKHNGNIATFTGKYTMKATVYVGGIPIPITYNFGSYTHSFTSGIN